MSLAQIVVIELGYWLVALDYCWPICRPNYLTSSPLKWPNVGPYISIACSDYHLSLNFGVCKIGEEMRNSMQPLFVLIFRNFTIVFFYFFFHHSGCIITISSPYLSGTIVATKVLNVVGWALVPMVFIWLIFEPRSKISWEVLATTRKEKKYMWTKRGSICPQIKALGTL